MINRLKILVYSDCYLYGGSEKVILNIIRNPIIRENSQIIFAYRKHRMYTNNLINDYTKQEQAEFLHPLPILSNRTLFYNLYLKKLPWIIKKISSLPLILFDKIGIYFLYNLIIQIIAIKKIKPDIIHINNGGYPAAYSCNTMVVASKLCHVQVLYQVNNIAEIQIGIFDKIYDKFIQDNINFFITASSEAREKLSINRNFDLEKIKKIPNTILDESVTSTRQSIIAELKYQQNDFILCNVALLETRKGQQYLLEALSKIKNNHPLIFREIRLIIVGNGEEEYRLKNLAVRLGISNNICFLGYRSDSINFINACDLFVLPSIASEDMPLTILSAMCKGKTIIATDFAGIKEEIENGVSGILLSKNIETLASDLATAIIKIYNNRENTYGKKAQERFNEIFSPATFGSALVEIYQSISVRQPKLSN